MDLRERNVFVRPISEITRDSVKEGQSTHVEPVHLNPLGQHLLPHVTPKLAQEAVEAGSLAWILPPAGN